jgi:WD40 repeat protein
LYGHKGWINDLAFSPDGKFLATISRDGTAKLWDISPTGNQELLALDSQHSNLNAIAYSPDGKLLAASGNDTTSTIIWDVSSRQPASILEHEANVNVVKFSPDGTLLAAAKEDSTVRIWDVASGQEQRVLVGHTDVSENLHYNGISNLSFSPDGERLATAGEDGLVKIWDVETGEELSSLSAHPDGRAALSIAFSHDGRFLAAGTELPSIITIWDSSTGEDLMTLPGYEANRIFQLAFSPDGNLLAVGNNGGLLEVWQLPDGLRADGEKEAEILFSIPSANAMRALSFNSSGTQIITAAQIWDANTGELLLTISNPEGVGDAEFSPDGTRVAVAGLDGLVRLFTLDLAELIELAQSRVTRSLTTAECQQYLHLDKCPGGE